MIEKCLLLKMKIDFLSIKPNNINYNEMFTFKYNLRMKAVFYFLTELTILNLIPQLK